MTRTGDLRSVARTAIELVGGGAVSSAAPPTTADIVMLLPAERRLVAGVVERRAAEIATGRRIFRELLARLDRPAAALPADVDSVPIWPIGVTGSISHCEGCCVVVLDRVEHGLIGIDVEPATDLAEDLWSIVLSPEERLGVTDGRDALRRFCAKEVAHKVRFPVDRVMPEPSDVPAWPLGDGSYSVADLTVRVTEVDGFVVAGARRPR